MHESTETQAAAASEAATLHAADGEKRDANREEAAGSSPSHHAEGIGQRQQVRQNADMGEHGKSRVKERRAKRKSTADTRRTRRTLEKDSQGYTNTDTVPTRNVAER